MAVPKRHGSAPGTYFVTSRTWQGRAIFGRSEPCEIFLDSLLRYRNNGAYRLHGFVLMPDHFHVLLSPGDDTSLERAVQFIKGGSARSIRESLNFRFPVWQRGFSDHRIRNSEDYELHMNYMNQNPVKKHLVAMAKDFQWSSASGTVAIDGVPQGLKPLAIATAVRHG
jgi:putative transposase